MDVRSAVKGIFLVPWTSITNEAWKTMTKLIFTLHRAENYGDILTGQNNWPNKFQLHKFQTNTCMYARGYS